MNRCFDTIKDLVDDLHALYGKKSSNLNLYKRLLDLVKEDDEDAKNLVIRGFKEFFDDHESCLADPVNMIPQGTLIRYGDSTRVYIDIQKYLYQADAPERESIKQYLLCINALINPTKEKLDILKSAEQEDIAEDDEFSLNDGTPEGQFINDMMRKTTKSLKGMDLDPKNPAGMIAGLMQSGALGGFVDMIKSSMDGSKKLKPKRLMATIQKAMSKMMPDSESDSEEAEDKRPDTSLEATAVTSKDVARVSNQTAVETVASNKPDVSVTTIMDPVD